MSDRLMRLIAAASALLRNAWPQVLTMIVFMAAISLRFPPWFVALSSIVNGTAAAYLAHGFVSGPSSPGHDPFLGAVLVGSGIASVALTLKWWLVEKQSNLPSGVLLRLADHTEAASNPTLAWSGILTQWGSCAVFLVIVAVWALSGRQTK